MKVGLFRSVVACAAILFTEGPQVEAISLKQSGESAIGTVSAKDELAQTD